MLSRVVHQCKQSQAQSCTVLTDHHAIIDHAQQLNIPVYETPGDCQSGTERIAHIIKQKDYLDTSIIVNVQGDEPFIHPESIHQVADLLYQHPSASIATLYQPITCQSSYYSPHCVKVVLNHRNEALYFSRAPIPLYRDPLASGSTLAYKHVGLYAYRASFLKALQELPNSPLETAESLEQLRWLQADKRIVCAKAKHYATMDINTPEDLIKAQEAYAQCQMV